jgi:hypothetical protein
MSFDPDLLPPTLIYGSDRPDIRFRSSGGRQQFFCRNNRNLHLRPDDFLCGTYEAGALLHHFCAQHCLPTRINSQNPCPAFVTEHMVGKTNTGLATVTARPWPKWDDCPGVVALLEMTETPEERYFLETYLEDRGGQDREWRNEIVNAWNANWHHEPNGFGADRRQSKFDYLMWRTMRFPALIPQVWLNWLHASSEDDLKILDEYPSRVDFVAFWRGERHLIEIDGPSHYATYDEVAHTYSVDERAYARNLKIARSLQRDGWTLTRIARIEIKDVMEDEDAALWGMYDFLKFLPFFHERHDAPPHLADLGVAQLAHAAWTGSANDDIPF